MVTRQILVLVLIIVFGLGFNVPLSKANGKANNNDEEIKALKSQVQQLLKRIEDLEKAQKE